MKVTSVHSSIIQSISHDSDAGILQINFTDGRRRRFDGVPITVISNILTAQSPGAYYVQHVRNAGFAEVSI